MKLSFKEIKQAGKTTLKSQLSNLILVRILAYFANTVVSLFSITLGGYIFSGPIEYGVLNTYYRAFLGQEIEPKDGLEGFKNRFGDSFLSGIIVALIRGIPLSLLLAVILAVITSFASASSLNDMIDFGVGAKAMALSLSTIAVIAIVDIVCVVFIYAFRMAQFILLLEPDLGGFDALKASATLMHGEKFRMLRFDASFILWFILVLLTGTAAGLWVYPYYTSARVVFMAEIYNRKRKEVGMA